ncbi:MAG: glycosyltransferase family 2 protein [Chloroflexi bacterium]|nr:glycosyltransferase family 2 protein [Chloroflexota bacterium]
MRELMPGGGSHQAGMFCSIIIPTIGRDTLTRAVESALTQEFRAGEFEVIVVNDSGKPLPDAQWQRSPNVRLIHTMRRERSVARNAGAALAKGKYFCFLDDDDWLLPGALEAIWAVARDARNAAWLYGGIRIVDESGNVLGEMNSGLQGNRSAQVTGGAWVPLQSSFILGESFFQAGGFNPAILVTQDLDLCRRITLYGELANTPMTIACLFRGRTWRSSTDYRLATEFTRWSRDAILSQPGAFRRLLSSADESYWRGRMLHLYLSSIIYNLRRRSLSTAMSRSLYGLVTLGFSVRHLLSRSFWQAVRADHVPETLHFVMQAQEVGSVAS